MKKRTASSPEEQRFGLKNLFAKIKFFFRLGQYKSSWWISPTSVCSIICFCFFGLLFFCSVCPGFGNGNFPRRFSHRSFCFQPDINASNRASVYGIVLIKTDNSFHKALMVCFECSFIKSMKSFDFSTNWLIMWAIWSSW